MKTCNNSKELSKRLSKKCVTIVGLGGIGSFTAELLARNGIGSLILIDPDKVEKKNLHRQLYKTTDIGKNKSIATKQKLSTFSKTDVTVLAKMPVVIDTDLIIDCTDNMDAKSQINDLARTSNVPWIFSSAVGTKGMVRLVKPDLDPDDWFETISTKKYKTSKTEGILNTACNATACFAVTESIKFFLKQKPSGLVSFDAWNT